jgi:hypothetical protein
MNHNKEGNMNHKLGYFVPCILAMTLTLTVGVTAGGDGIEASANGSGQIHVGSPPELRTFSFTAQTDSLGISRGQEELNNRSTGTVSHVQIDCLSVSGNVATMGGVVTDISPVTPPFFVPGNFVVFQVIDNGHGQSGIPDDISLTFFYATGNPNPGCTGFGTLVTTPVEHGNVTVH